MPYKDKEKRREWWERYKKAHKEEIKNYKLKRDHGLSLDEFNLLLEVQGYSCAICGTTEWRGRYPYVDHDHKTGRIRGLLCKRCNLVLGEINDDVYVVDKMREYLLKTS